MSESGRWLTVEEWGTRVIVSAQIDPRKLADDDRPAIAKEITAEMGRLPGGRPVVLAGDWPLWAIARAARLAHPRAAWIGVQRDGTVIVVGPGQEAGRPVPLASVHEGAYVGGGSCDLDFHKTATRGVYQLQVTHPTPGRPIEGHTKVDLNSVQVAIEKLQPPSDLVGVLITGYAWCVVIAMLANSPALRSAQWCAVDEPRLDYAVMSWGTYKGEEEIPGELVPHDDLREIGVPKRGPLLRRLLQWWTSLPIKKQIAYIGLCGALIGLCGIIYGTTVPLLMNRPQLTPTATVTPTVTPTMTATPMPTATPTLTITVTPP